MKDSSTAKKSIFDNPLLSTKIKSANVKPKELLLGYFIGPFGALLASGIFGSYLNTYLTNVLFRGQLTDGVKQFMTLLPLLSTILIVIGNLVVGQLVERTRTKAGKARPWILLASVVMGAACILMFVIPWNLPVIGKAIWYAISYNLYYSVAYPLYNTSNSTLIPVSTRNSSQRGLLASATNIAHLGVMGAGSMVFPMLASFLLFGADENPIAFAWVLMFIIVGVFTAFCTIMQYYFTRERVTEETLNMPKDSVKKISIKQQLKGVATEPYWWIIIIFYLVFQFAGGMKNLSMQYFCQWVLEPFGEMNRVQSAGVSQTVLGVLGAVPMAVAVALVWPLANKFTKQKVVIAGMGIGVVGGIIAWIGGELGNFPLVAVGVAVKCLGSAPACYMILAMISDMLDHIEAKRGYRCDGLTMSIYSSLMVASTPVMTGVFNGLITASGYDSRLAEQATGTLTVIKASYVWIETIAYLVCGILLVFFTVEKHLKDDKQKILDRQKAEAIAAGVEWIPPEERLKMEEEKARIASEEARKAELKTYCEKKGLVFEEEEAKYQAKQEEKRRKAEEKKAAKAAKKGIAPAQEEPDKLSEAETAISESLSEVSVAANPDAPADEQDGGADAKDETDAPEDK